MGRKVSTRNLQRVKDNGVALIEQCAIVGCYAIAHFAAEFDKGIATKSEGEICPIVIRRPE